MIEWLQMAVLVALSMAKAGAPHTNGDCMACQIAAWQWEILDAHGWDPLYLGWLR